MKRQAPPLFDIIVINNDNDDDNNNNWIAAELPGEMIGLFALHMCDSPPHHVLALVRVNRHWYQCLRGNEQVWQHVCLLWCNAHLGRAEYGPARGEAWRDFVPTLPSLSPRPFVLVEQYYWPCGEPFYTGSAALRHRFGCAVCSPPEARATANRTLRLIRFDVEELIPAPPHYLPPPNLQFPMNRPVLALLKGLATILEPGPPFIGLGPVHDPYYFLVHEPAGPNQLGLVARLKYGSQPHQVSFTPISASTHPRLVGIF